MTPPTLYTRAFGSIGARIFIYPLTCMFLWDALIAQGDGGVALVLVAFAAAVSFEAKKLATYRAWKKLWDEASGLTPKPSLFAILMRYRLFKLWLLVCGWSIGVNLLWIAAGTADASDDTFRTILYLGWFGCVVHCVIFIRQWMRATAKPKTEPALAVSVCLPLPKASQGYRQIVSALPVYCQELIARSVSTSSISARHPR